MTKKRYSIVGMIVGVVLVLLGSFTMSGLLGGNTVIATSNSSILYESGYGKFGADFYTYVTNNAAEAASAARTVSSNLNAIANLLKSISGIIMIAFGLFMNCFFGIKFIETKDEEKSSVLSNLIDKSSEQQNSHEETVEEDTDTKENNTFEESLATDEDAVISESTVDASSQSQESTISDEVLAEKDSFLEEIESKDSMIEIWNIWRKYNLSRCYPTANDYIRNNKDQEQLNGKKGNLQAEKEAIIKLLQD